MPQRQIVDPTNGHLLLAGSPTCIKEIGERECGHCVYIVSGKEIFIGEAPEHQLNKKPWSKLRLESVYLPAVESYGPLATYIINACKKMKCSDDVTRFKVKLDSLNPLKKLDEPLLAVKNGDTGAVTRDPQISLQTEEGGTILP